MVKSRVVEHRTEEFAIELETAKIVVAGGRGVGGPEGFELLRELSQVLDAAMGASGAACNAGWVPSSWQIGQTGKKVAPDLYFAIGISGASQHVAGFTEAKHVVAINKDEDAPIFKTAEVGIVDDYQRIVPLLTRKLRSRREHSERLAGR